MRSKIDFPYLQSKDTLGDRRKYLADVFNEGPDWVNKRFFNVDPVKSHQGFKPLKRLGNLIRGVFRHAVLPFPITYTDKKSQKLTKKQVISIEQFMLGNAKPESFFSALRIGVNQYANYLFGASFALVSLSASLYVAAAVAGSAISFGIIPLSLCVVGAGYLAFVGLRAKRKQAVTTGLLKGKRVFLRKKHTYKEKLFVKMYTLVSLLERVKESVQKYPEEAKDIILKNLKDQISEHGYTGDEKYLVRILSNIVIKHVKKFEEEITSDDITESELLGKLDELISNLEKIDIREELTRLGLNPELGQELNATGITLQNVHTQTPNYRETSRLTLPIVPMGGSSRKISDESMLPGSVVSSDGNSDDETTLDEDIHLNGGRDAFEIMVNTSAKPNRKGRRKNGGNNRATNTERPNEEEVFVPVESNVFTNISDEEEETKENGANEASSKSKFDELMRIKKTIKDQANKLMRVGNCDDASTLNILAQRVTLKNCVDSPLAYVKELIEKETGLTGELKEILDGKLESPSTVSFGIPLNGESRMPFGNSNRRKSNGHTNGHTNGQKNKKNNRHCIAEI